MIRKSRFYSLWTTILVLPLLTPVALSQELVLNQPVTDSLSRDVTTKEYQINIDDIGILSFEFSTSETHFSGWLIRLKRGLETLVSFKCTSFDDSCTEKRVNELLIGTGAQGQYTVSVSAANTFFGAPTSSYTFSMNFEPKLLSEIDTDGDGVSDDIDAFPQDSSESNDSDLDGVGDNSDKFPNDSSESEDTDGDGTGNNSDLDDDDDGYLDTEDDLPLDANDHLDTDNDGIGNNRDNDDDNDGLTDTLDSHPLDAAQPFHSGLLVTSASSSTSLVNSVYQTGSKFTLGFTNKSTLAISVTKFEATDGNGTIIAESIDPSLLGDDGVLANSETLALSLTLNSDAQAPVTLRYEYLNPLNNRTEFVQIRFSASGSVVTKSDPQDTDKDGKSNTADTDDDNDGVEDSADAFPVDATESLDTDSDGIGNNADTDDDNDGYSDAYELETGTDPLDANDFKPPYDDLNGFAYHWHQHSVVAGATITRTSDTDAQVLTDNQGQYTFDETAEGAYELIASQAISDADTNRTITSADALAALKIAVGLNPNSDPDGDGPLEAIAVSPYQLIAADMNQDGRVTSADALAILKVAVGLSEALEPSWQLVEDSQTLWTTHNDKSKVFDASQAYALTYPDQTQANFAAVLLGDVNASWKPQENAQVVTHDHFSAYAKATGAPLALWGIRDSDEDGLSDEQEDALGTSPFDTDTDADGVNDIDDVYPLDPDKSEEVPAGVASVPLLGESPKNTSTAPITLVTPVLLRGDMNDWGESDVFTLLEDGSYRLSIQLQRGTYAFKIATDDWAVMDLGAEDEASRLIVMNRPVRLSADSTASFMLTVTNEHQIVFTIDHDANGAKFLVVSEVQ